MALTALVDEENHEYECLEHLDQVVNSGRKETNQDHCVSYGFEDCQAVVVDFIDLGQILQQHEQNTDENAVADSRRANLAEDLNGGVTTATDFNSCVIVIKA